MSSDYQTDVIYFDFKNAFNSVSHNEILKIYEHLWKSVAIVFVPLSAIRESKQQILSISHVL